MNQPRTIPGKLEALQRETFAFFVRDINPRNGLVVDKNQAGSPASIAAVGMALSAYPIGVERGYISREHAIALTLAALRFFHRSAQGPEPDATGHKGFYYHFLDMEYGRRVWNCELSTVDTALLLAGMLTAAQYFGDDSADEHEIRTLADSLYRRTDWEWASCEGATVSHGWYPESGFLPFCWQGYDEALLLYVLGLGSPTHPLSAESYAAWTSTYQWRTLYGHELLHCGPLFTHQMSHIWTDFRGIQDRFMREKQIDYFENSRRATYVQRQYAIHNPGEFDAYGANCWGLTAGDGPGWVTRHVKGRERRFFDYVARGVPDGPDDGTISPWVVVASLPFAPEIVLPALDFFDGLDLGETDGYRIKASFNPTFPVDTNDAPGWVSPWCLRINHWPIVLMIENHRSGFVWDFMQRCPYLVRGLRRAGFSGGWLETDDPQPPRS